MAPVRVGRPKKSPKGKPVPKQTKQRLLREGVKLLGRDVVALELQVPLERLNAWLRGRATMPDAKLPTLADRMLEKLSKP
jgi:outer membrane biogenesis lipoprotein LolB